MRVQNYGFAWSFPKKCAIQKYSKMPWPFLKSYIIWDKSYWSFVFGDNKGTAVYIAPSCRSTFYFAKQKSYKLIPLPKGKPDNQERELMFLILVWPGSWRQETSFSFCDITASASTKMNDLSEWTHFKKIKLKLKQPMKKNVGELVRTPDPDFILVRRFS